ncbi:MAG TPA: hypothetical protein VFS75_02525 [Candidatus Paceibacterota bacterium]|nr:hypothetical protein [Candidatus Paceibacterota bacterium]
MATSNVTNVLLRVALAFAFLYPPVSAYLAPYDWIGYFPQFVHGIVSDTVLLSLWGLLEVGIGLWILSGKRIALPSVIAAILLALIVLFNLAQMEVVFRDVSLALAALARAGANRRTSML